MNRKEIIQKVIDEQKRTEKLIDKFQDLFGFSDGVLCYDTLFKSEDLIYKLAAQLIGDDQDWLEWYIFENNCGEKGLEAGYDGQMKPIKSIDDLLELIDNKKHENK